MVEETASQEAKSNEGDNNTESSSDDVGSDISPLELAKKLNEESKETLKKISEERKKIERASADLLIGGGSLAGNTIQKPKIKTQDDLDQEVAEQIANSIK